MPETPAPVYKRILLKLSGEAFMGPQGFGLHDESINQIAIQVQEVAAMGVQVAAVIGGGNIFRGRTSDARGLDRVSADHMGMLATVINGLALQDHLEKLGVHTRLMTAIEMHQIAEPFIRRRAERHLEKERVVLLAAGTGNPYFSTDTAAALRAMELKAEVLLKASKVDGIYDSDPMTNSNAQRFARISYLDVISKSLAVIDATAVSLCMDHSLPILVFDLTQPGNIKRAVLGEEVGSMITA